MAHFRLDWARDATGELDMVRCELSVAFHADGHLRPAGTLMLHASEVNALDRLLTIGSRFENPAHTFEIVAADIPRPRATSTGRR